MQDSSPRRARSLRNSGNVFTGSVVPPSEMAAVESALAASSSDAPGGANRSRSSVVRWPGRSQTVPRPR